MEVSQRNAYVKYQPSGEAGVVVQLVEHLLSVCEGLVLMLALLSWVHVCTTSSKGW